MNHDLLRKQDEHWISMTSQIQRSTAWLCLALILSGACAAAQPEAAYERGVRAFQLKDYRLARDQWEFAVKQGRAAANNNLGYLLYEGLGGPADRPKAVMLWRLAAERGHPEAQWHLAQTFEDGKTVKADPVQAFAWYRCTLISAALAKDGNDYLEPSIHVDARSSAKRLLARLTEEQAKGAAPSSTQCAGFAAPEGKPVQACQLVANSLMRPHTGALVCLGRNPKRNA